MPAPVDLAGKRYGHLVALKRTKWRDGKTAWTCRCDCGREEDVPLGRLSARDSDRRAIRACSACRSRACAICGTPYLMSGSTMTCGSESCRAIYRREKNAELEARAEMLSPGGRAERQRKYRARIMADPVSAAAVRERDREIARRHRLRMTDDDREARRLSMRSAYAENPGAWREYYRAWAESLSQEHKDRRAAAARKSVREYERRKALARMLRDAAILMDMEIKRDE